MSVRVRMPADVELEDKLAFGLSARQLLLLALTALLAYGLFALASPLVPLPVAAAFSTPLVLTGCLLALGRRDGLSGDRYALALGRFLTRPRRAVLAPEGIAPSERRGRQAIAPLDLPVRSISRSGVVELDDGSFCVLLRAGSATFALRSDEEQEALVDGFARFLNGLTEPAQIVVRSEPVDLAARAAALADTAGSLDGPALQAAAVAHARFLAGLEREDEIRRREIVVLLVTRARAREAASVSLLRRAAEAVELLSAAGVDLQPLDGSQAAALLGRALDPPGPPTGSELSGVITRC